MKPRMIVTCLSHCLVVKIAIERHHNGNIPDEIRVLTRKLHCAAIDTMTRYEYVNINLIKMYRASVVQGLESIKSIIELCSYLIGVISDVANHIKERESYDNVIAALEGIITFYDPDRRADADYEAGYQKYLAALEAYVGGGNT